MKHFPLCEPLSSLATLRWAATFCGGDVVMPCQLSFREKEGQGWAARSAVHRLADHGYRIRHCARSVAVILPR